jgi:uncharacterized protein YciW
MSGAAALNEVTDVVDELLGPSRAGRLRALRDARPAVRAGIQASWRALFTPPHPGALSLRDRELVALRVAVLLDDPALSAWHQQRAIAAGATPAELDSVGFHEVAPYTRPRLRQLLAHTDRLTLRPRESGPAHLAALQTLGLGVPEVVSLSQLVAFENFLARLLCGLRALADRQAPEPPPGTPEERA